MAKKFEKPSDGLGNRSDYLGRLSSLTSARVPDFQTCNWVNSSWILSTSRFGHNESSD